jgi:hypothetical protein
LSSFRAAPAAAALCAVLTAGPAMAKGGFYIGLGIGGAVVDGETGIAVAPTSDDGRVTLAPAARNDPSTVRTDFGGGLATMFRLGYNIFGAVAIEMNLLAHGTNFSSNLEGAGHLDFDAVIHPLGIAELAGALEESIWDPYVLIGGGFSYGAYTSAIDGDDKGWFGAELQTGFGLNVHVLPFMSVGADFRFSLPFYDKWYFNFDRGESFTPLDTPDTLIFTPMALATFHFG